MFLVNGNINVIVQNPFISTGLEPVLVTLYSFGELQSTKLKLDVFEINPGGNFVVDVRNNATTTAVMDQLIFSYLVI